MDQVFQSLLNAPHFYLTVAIPFAILLIHVILSKQFILWKELPLLVISWTLTYHLAYWVDGNSALILAPISVLIVVLTAFKHKSWTVLNASLFTYLSFLVIDVLQAFNTQFSQIGWWFVTGIGGAGVKDGLIVFPFFTGLFTWYINARKGGKLRFSR